MIDKSIYSLFRPNIVPGLSFLISLLMLKFCLATNQISSEQAINGLFSISSAPVAIPRASWLGFDILKLSAQILVIQPSAYEYNRIVQAIDAVETINHNMDISNI